MIQKLYISGGYTGWIGFSSFDYCEPVYYTISFDNNKAAHNIKYVSYGEMGLVADAFLHNMLGLNLDDVEIILNNQIVTTEEFKNGVYK